MSERKSTIAVILLSMLFPGLAHLYIGKTRRGVEWLTLGAVGVVIYFATDGATLWGNVIISLVAGFDASRTLKKQHKAEDAAVDKAMDNLNEGWSD